MPFRIVRNDITRMKVDAIVNTANPKVRVGRGVDTAIYEAAGWDELLKEREKIGPMRRGSAAITPAFGLSARYIIHTVGPKWDEDDPERAKKTLRDCYDNSMSLALENDVKSIAFPLISTGSYSFPKEIGLRIAYDTISRYLYVSEMDVYLVVYDDEAFALSKKLTDDIDEFIDSRYVEESKAKVSKAEELWRTGSFHTVSDAEASFGSAIPPASPQKASFGREEALPKKHRRSIRNIFPSRKSNVSEDKEEIMEDTVSYSPAPAGGIFNEYHDLDDLLKNAGETFQQRLFRYIDLSGMSDVEVYKGANLSKQTFSKIKQPGHIPKKRTIFALALSMKLSVDDTRDLLESAGQAFSPSDKVDLTVQFCMYNDIYSIFDVEHILFEKFGETLVS